MPDPLDAMRAKTKKGPPCTVGLALAKLTKSERAAVNKALVAAGDPEDKMTCAGISRWLTDLGHDIRPHTLARHHRGDCGCGRG